nr:MFS transporter [Actinocorallia populi]
MFAETGLSAAQISTLFILWSAVSFLLEIPSGLLADVFSRRRLLILAPLVTGLGYALWTFFPSYPAFAAGFVLWGAGGALASGAHEALLYEELARLGAAASYPRVFGRARALGTTAAMAASAVAAPVLAAGGFLSLGIASVLVPLLTAAVARSLPEHRHDDRRHSTATGTTGERSGATEETRDGTERRGEHDGGRDGDSGSGSHGNSGCDSCGNSSSDGDGSNNNGNGSGSGDDRGGGGEGCGLGLGGGGDEDGEPGFRVVLRDGLAQVRGAPAVRRLLWAVVLMSGLSSMDEYLPLLAGEASGGVSSLVPLLVLLPAAGDAVGGWCAGRGGLRPSVALAFAAVCLAVGAAVRHPLGFVPIGVAFGLVQWTMAGTEARLQHRLADRSRATVTSLAGFGMEVVAVLVFAAYGLGSLWSPSWLLFALAALPQLALALALRGRGG